VLDVAGWGARPAPLQGEVQRRLLRVAERVLASCGLRMTGDKDSRSPDYAICETSGTGDGLNVMLPADTDLTVILPVLVRTLAAELTADNVANVSDRMRMRMAVSIGLVSHGAVGFSGPLITELSRLVNSRKLHDELIAEPEADLTVALADAAHSMIIKSGYPGIPATQFRATEVTEKEFSGTAWIWISTRQWTMPAYSELESGDPQRAGEYRLVARVGTGAVSGSGAGGGAAAGRGSRVYLAGAPDGGWVAVKLFDPALTADADTRQRLEAGVLSGRLARGPYLAPAFADGEGPRGAWVASALVRGPSLNAVITETGPLPARSALWLAAGTAHALAALHGDDLTHGGLAAANVLLSADGPVVTDVGVSRAALRASGPVSEADDIFALGSLAFFAATGRLPFRDNPESGPGAVGDLDLAGCPEELMTFVPDCLAEDPTRRPAAHELALGLTEEARQLPHSWLPPAVAVRLEECESLPASSLGVRTPFRRRPRR
jgi:serine/threonine protein kinase